MTINSANPFQFKQFTVHQDRCAMKVGTDGVLLGAWTSLTHQPNSVLDIGAGTGLIALQLAQRSFAETIDALELDDNAYEQCVQNFETSPWGDRLFCYHASFMEFVGEIEDKYDLIVCNPPFYKEEVSSGNDARDMARQSSSLPLTQLLDGVSQLLSGQGRFTVVLPYSYLEETINDAQHVGLYPNRMLMVRGNPASPFKRVLLEFSKKITALKKGELTIETERHQYTPEYVALTQAFYLKM